MRRNLVLSLTALLALGVVTGPLFFGPAPRARAGIHAPAKFYPNRWVFVFLSLQSDTHVEQIRQIARTASARLSGARFKETNSSANRKSR